MTGSPLGATRAGRHAVSARPSYRGPLSTAIRVGAAALLLLAALGGSAAPLGGGTAQAESLTMQPLSQCGAEPVMAPDPYTGFWGHVPGAYTYYCGPTFQYPPEWYAAR